MVLKRLDAYLAKKYVSLLGGEGRIQVLPERNETPGIVTAEFEDLVKAIFPAVVELRSSFLPKYFRRDIKRIVSVLR